MASNSVFVQYPLAYMRYSVSGWIDAYNITSSGDYSLIPASEDSGKRLYLLKTPLSDTEFFAIEYRKQGRRYSEDMDVKVYGTGLVVYRVNTKFIGNHIDNGDQIYVFRPEENEINAASGNIMASCYGGTGAPDSVGSLDLNAGIRDGALVYSDGTNSGIKISDIVISDSKLDFHVEFADLSDQQLWQNIDLPEWITFEDTLDMYCDGDGSVYLLTNSRSGLVVSLYRNGNWSVITTPEPDGLLCDARLRIYDGTPYILGHTKSTYTYCLKYYSENSWKTLLSGKEISQYQDFDIHDDTIWLAYTKGSFPYALNVMSYSISENKIKETRAGSPDVCHVSVSVLENGTPVISYRGVFDGGKPAIDILENGTWKNIPLSDSGCGQIQICTYQNKLYIATADNSSDFFSYENGTIKRTDFSSELPGSSFFASPSAVRDEINIIANTSDENDLSLYILSDGTFRKYGNSISNELVRNPSLSVYRDCYYSSFVNSRNNIELKQIKRNPSFIVGDINEDGTVSAIDALLLKEYLLTKRSDDNMIQKADINNDGKVNIIDLILLKSVILS